MNEYGKINPKLPFFILDTLNSDSITFNLKPNAMFNLVYSNLKSSYKNLEVGVNGKYDKKKSFTLNKEFFQEYIDCVQYEIDKKYNIGEAEYFRSLLYQYCKLPIFEREKVLFKYYFDTLNNAIQNKQRVRIYLKGRKEDGPREVEPYSIEWAEEFNYLLGYCLKREEYRVFRLSHIESISILDEKIVFMNENKMSEYKENFDPFLSFGQQVIVRFTENGKYKYKTIISNRPKLIEQEEDIYTFECSEKKAQVYFPQFFTTIEILEPKSLRVWYKKKLEDALKNYE